MLGLTTPGGSNSGILVVGVLQKVQQQQKLLSSIKFGGVCLHFGSLLPPPPELSRAKRWRGGYSTSVIASSSVAASSMGNVQREKVGPGQESVWDYPRPPRLEAVPERVKIVFNSKVIADTTSAYRVLETSHPPVYYIPQKDIKMEYVRKAAGSSFCEWKGNATYWSVNVDGRSAEKVGWSYEEPTSQFLPIRSYLAFYAAPMDACYVGDEKAEPQPGGFYGGWVTSRVVGPFKGGPGSWGW
ncbi:unnamed protein product [Sphagnum compactum]